MTVSYLGPAHAAVAWAVSLDANSSGPTDAIIEPAAIDAKSFRVGAVINGTSANPLNGVFGWQFTINYNASGFIPQGDPNPAASLLGLYPDGAAPTVSFGGQITTGTVNWAGLLSPAVGCAFGSFTGSRSGSIGQVTVFYTLLVKTGCPATVSISSNTLLANVAFELLNKPGTRVFSITNVIFVGSTGSPISGVIVGTVATETVTNDPPHAKFTAMSAPRVGPLAFTFNATASSDSDDSIPRPGGYFWDFGDGTQDLGLTGSVVTHNYTMASRFNVTLRVQDSLGATGAARDSLGGMILNVQPSHMFLSVSTGVPVNQPPVASFTFSPISPTVGQPVFFNGSFSFDPDGFIVSWTWNFGDGSPIVHVTTPVHSYASPGNFTVTLTVLDNGNATATASALISVRPALVVPTVVAVDMDPATPGIQNSTTASGNFALNVDVLNVTGLFAWQFQLNYDNTLLSTQQANVTLGPFWQSAVAAGGGLLIIKANQANGTLFLAFALIGQVPPFTGTGVLAAVGFTSLRTGTGTLHLSDTILVGRAGAVEQIIPSTTRDGFVSTISVDRPPVASFTFSPTSPTAGEFVFFDGSKSFDPDGFIAQWAWSFGDGFMIFGPSAVEHSYNSPGNFTVTLTVIDNAGLRGVAQAVVQVHPKLQHDVAVAFIDVQPRVAVSTEFVSIDVGLQNLGLSNETVSLTVYFDSRVISTVTGIFIPVAPRGCVGCQGFAFVPVLWDTSGVAPGNYTISATVFLSIDQNLSNNSKTDGQVTILQPPVLTVTPSSGSLGTKVLVQGSGFPTLFPGFVGVVDVTFDDMFLGFTFNRNGRFNFTFNVPHAEPGLHLVKAIDGFTAARGSTTFLVLATPSGNLGVSVDAGVVYFPGETANIYVLATLNGSPVGPSNVQLQLLLFKPDGSNATLTPTRVAPGLFKASFTIPRAGSLGTYAILARAHMSGPLDASALRSFEVKPTWISQQGQNIAMATALAGVVGVVAVAWRKGFLRRKNGESIPPPFS